MYTLHIWDLGSPSIPGEYLISFEKHDQIRPLASLHDHAARNLASVHPTRDGEGLLILAHGDGWLNGHIPQTYYYIYEIYPTSDTPHFRQIAKLSQSIVEEGQYCFSFEHMAAIFKNQQLCVWNFIHNTKLMWTTPIIDGNTMSGVKISLEDNFVILIYENVLLIWRIPALYPEDSALSNHVHTLAPIWNSSLNWPVNSVSGDPYPSTVDILDNWYIDSGHPIYFDCIPDTEDAPEDLRLALPTLIRYRLDIPSHLNQSNPPFADILLTEIATFYAPAVPGNLMRGYRLSHGHIFGNWAFERDLEIHCHRGDLTASVVSRPSLSLLTLPQSPYEDVVNNSSTCPTSGKIFLHLGRNPHEIVVLDLLCHPGDEPTFCPMRLCIYDPIEDEINTVPGRVMWQPASDEDEEMYRDEEDI